MDNISSLDRLFAMWKDAHASEADTSYISGTVPKTAFLPDGIIDKTQFNAKSERVLFIAKEAFWFRPDDSFEKSAENANIVMFWHKEVAFGRTKETMFSKRLSMLANAYFSSDFKSVNKNHAALQAVAVMNLNKRGGFSHCVWDTLETYVAHYKDFISKEIQLIAPTTIICCGDGVRWLLNKYIDISPDIKLLTISHPSYFALSDSEYLSQLECAVHNKPWKAREINTDENHTSSRTKGIIFDTNKTYSEGATFDMLTSGKISAYGGASRFINSFSSGDYAFYYVKGKGVVAAGKIISEATMQADNENLNESFKMAQIIVPENIPFSEKGLKAISASKLKELFGGFYFASTVKRPYLSEKQSQLLIEKLKEVYEQPKSS